MNQNHVRTLANRHLSFIKFYVLLNSEWFLYFFFTVAGWSGRTGWDDLLFNSAWLLYFFFTVVGFWNFNSSIIVYKIGLWWSSLMMYRKVASCLHQSFLHARKEREDTINFSQVFGGRARKESALLFYEVLVCSICVF